jgi:hypothetical protein
LAALLAEPHYIDPNLPTVGNNTQPTLSLVLPELSTIVLPHQWWHTTAHIGVATVSAQNVVSVLAEAMLFDRNLEPFTSYRNPRPASFFSAIAKDPRDGKEYLVASLIRACQVQDRSNGHPLSLSDGNAEYLALAEYLQMALVSADTTNASAAGHNAGIVRPTIAAENPIFALQGFATSGNRAFAVDYEAWDFADIVHREFRTVAIPSYSDSFPPSHQTFDSPQYFRPHFPDMPGIGSASSMLAVRESAQDTTLTPLYSQPPAGYGLARPDITSRSVSFVCLKGYSLIHPGMQASEASCLVPLHSQAAQEVYRFAGRQINGTTVRFEPVARADGVSFGRSQREEDIPPVSTTQRSLQIVYRPSAASDASGTYYATSVNKNAAPADSIDVALGLSNASPSLVEATLAAPPPNSPNAKLYNFVAISPPMAGFRTVEQSAQGGRHHRRYNQSQQFTRHQSYDERGFVAGAIVDAMLHTGINTGGGIATNSDVLDFYTPTSVGAFPDLNNWFGQYYPAVSPTSPLWPASAQPAFFPLPLISDKDYACTSIQPGGVKFAAGVFGYNGAGPMSTERVSYVGRGLRTTATVGGFIQSPQFEAQGSATYQITDEPVAVSGDIDVTLDTKEVSVWVQWSASLQGLGQHRNPQAPQVVDIDAHNGRVRPWFYCSTDRIAELQPVLVADLFIAARGTVSVESEWSYPEELGLPSSFSGVGASPLSEVLGDNNVFAQNEGGDYYFHYSLGPITSQGPVPVAKPPGASVQVRDKKPMHAGTYIFNRHQTARLLAGESVSPTHWLEYDEGDPRAEWPMLMKWHNDGFGTLRPVFRLSFA